MRLRIFYCALIPAFILSSCNSNTSGKIVGEYYNLDSLLNTQINMLSAGQMRVSKKATLDGEKEEIIKILSKEQWENELKLFRDADMNVPSLSGVYTCNCGISDEKSNLLLNEYIPEYDDANILIRLFRIYYFEEISQVRKILIEEKEENELYFSSRSLVMNFESSRNGMILSSYSITGFQKLLLKDTVSYFIEGRIIKDDL